MSWAVSRPHDRDREIQLFSPASKREREVDDADDNRSSPLIKWINKCDKWVFIISLVVTTVAIIMHVAKCRKVLKTASGVIKKLDYASESITRAYDEERKTGPARRIISIFEDTNFVPDDWHLQQTLPSTSASTAKRMPDIPAQAVLTIFAEQARLVVEDVNVIRKMMLESTFATTSVDDQSDKSSLPQPQQPLDLMQITRLISLSHICHARLDILESNLPPATIRAISGFDAGDMRIRIKTYMESIDKMCADAVSRASSNIKRQL